MKFSYKVLCERYKKLREENISLLKENFKISNEYIWQWRIFKISNFVFIFIIGIK